MPLRKKSYQYIIYLIILSLIIPQVGKYTLNNVEMHKNINSKDTKEWTFMLYLCADT